MHNAIQINNIVYHQILKATVHLHAISRSKVQLLQNKPYIQKFPGHCLNFNYFRAPTEKNRTITTRKSDVSNEQRMIQRNFSKLINSLRALVTHIIILRLSCFAR